MSVSVKKHTRKRKNGASVVKKHTRGLHPNSKKHHFKPKSKTAKSGSEMKKRIQAHGHALATKRKDLSSHVKSATHVAPRTAPPKV